MTAMSASTSTACTRGPERVKLRIDPLEELGLQKAAEELQNWRPDVPGAGPEPEPA
jgi:hypothetical protein